MHAAAAGPSVDPQRLEAVEADLVSWGLLERQEGLHPTRRFRGALARAAAELAVVERREGRPAGNPVEHIVLRALRDHPLPLGAKVERDHERFLVALEIASLPEGVRQALGL